MPEEEGLEIIEDEPIVGPATFVEWYEEHESDDSDNFLDSINLDVDAGGDDAVLLPDLFHHALDAGDDEDELIGAMHEQFAQTGIQPESQTVGQYGETNYFTRLIDWLQGRRLVEDLGEHDFEINYLTFHVPPGGTGQLKMTNTVGSKFGVKLSLLGLGHGLGRSIKFAGTKDFRERDHCLQIAQRVRAHVRSYADASSGQATQLQIDIVELLSSITRSLEECPECSRKLDDAPFMFQQSEPTIDLRGDSVGQSQERTYTFESESNTEIGLPLTLSGIDVTPSIAVNRTLRLQSEVRYDFPGGHCFTPYTEVGDWVDFPFWRQT